MSYIVQRQDRFSVVAYYGLDPLTGRERRRWHPIGHDRAEAEQLAARLDRERDAAPAAPTGPVTFGEFLANTWIPRKTSPGPCHHRGLPQVRFHDLRHTHASLLVADGSAIKVESERLGHAHPAFTMHTYQHLLPSMSGAAAERFATLVATTSR